MSTPHAVTDVSNVISLIKTLYARKQAVDTVPAITSPCGLRRFAWWIGEG